MTMRSRDLTQIPTDTAAVGQKLLSETNSYRVIGDHLADILQDDQFAELYESTGREAISPSLLALVILFQFLESVPDREAAEMVVVRLDWKYALHLPLDYRGFDYSCLCYFRQRMVAHAKEALVFDSILAKVKALGFLKKRGKQRTDSLAVIGAVRILSVLETVSETLRTTVRALEQADPAWAERVLPASFREQYARMRSDYRLTEEEWQRALQQVGRDGFWLLDQILPLGRTPKAVGELEAVRTLRTVWAQRYERGEGGARLLVKTVDCTELIVTPHDPGVRAGEKRGKKWHGEKAHLTETAEAGGPNFITDVTTANASSGDVDALPQIRQRLAERGLTPGEHYVDAGYVSGKQLAESRAVGTELLGPPLADTSPQEFKIADFTVDQTAKQAICPAGQRSVKWSKRKERDGSAAVNIQFAAATCRACRSRARCTSGQGGRSLQLSEHYPILEARRLEAKTEAFRQKMRARPAIEATLSELVRQHGMRRHRYRGEAKRHFENLLKATACNLKRLTRALVARWEAQKLVGGRVAGQAGVVAASRP